MSDEDNPAPEPTLVEKFFQEIREIGLGERQDLSFPLDRLFEIFDDTAQAFAFEQMFDTFSQDPDQKRLVIAMIEGLVRVEKDHVGRSEDDVKSLDLYGRTISTSAIVGGGSALIWGPAAAGAVAVVGPVVVVAGGFGGLIYCLVKRNGINEGKRISQFNHDLGQAMIAKLEKRQGPNVGDQA